MTWKVPPAVALYHISFFVVFFTPARLVFSSVEVLNLSVPEALHLDSGRLIAHSLPKYPHSQQLPSTLT